MHSIFEFKFFLLIIYFFEIKVGVLFEFCVKNFESTKIWTCSASENDGLNFSFEKDIKVVVEKMTRNGKKNGGGRYH